MSERYLLGSFIIVFMAIGAYVNALTTEEQIVYTDSPNLVVYESEITGIVHSIDNGRIYVKSIEDRDYDVVYEEAIVKVTNKTVIENFNNESTIKQGDLVSVSFLNKDEYVEGSEAVAKRVIVYATPLCLNDTDVRQISLDTLNSIKKGMTYRHVVNLLGGTKDIGGSRVVLEYSVNGEQILIPFERTKNICEYSFNEIIGSSIKN